VFLVVKIKYVYQDSDALEAATSGCSQQKVVLDRHSFLHKELSKYNE
jgi:hypothetical protein